jgi:hypothetical protein
VINISDILKDVLYISFHSSLATQTNVGIGKMPQFSTSKKTRGYIKSYVITVGNKWKQIYEHQFQKP